jgi:arginase
VLAAGGGQAEPTSAGDARAVAARRGGERAAPCGRQGTCACSFLSGKEPATPAARSATAPTRFARRSPLLAQLRRACDILQAADPECVEVVGGDCSVEIGPVSFLNGRYRPDFAVVWLDAHADLQAPETSPSHTLHGMPLRVLLGDGDAEIVAAAFSRLEPRQVFLAGVRDFDPPERAFVDAHRIATASVRALGSDPTLLAREVVRAGFSRVYVHLDLDVVDPRAFASLAVPTRDGLEVEALVAIVAALHAAVDVIGFSITECSPAHALPPADARALARIAGELAPPGKTATGPRVRHEE